jgi:DNA-directed RNA polymerase specialized sigma24 family protein
MSFRDDYPWAYYADLQDRSRKSARLTPYWWGMEAGMTYLLNAIATDTVPADPKELEATLNRTIASAARLHRSRATAHSYNRPIDEPATADAAAAEARIELLRIVRLVSTNDAGLLVDAGLGYTDREIAMRRGSTPGAIRVRISRLRLKIAA